NSHQLHNVQWDGRNWQNGELPDGEYRFNIEFTEHNASAANLGKYKQVSFLKGPEPVVLTIPNETYFRDMSLTWEPIILNGTISGRVSDENNQPISGATISTGDQSATSNTEGNYLLSLPPGTYSITCTAVGYHPFGMDNVVVSSELITTVDIMLATVSLSDPHAVPAALILAPPYPNPTSSGTKISFYDGYSGSSELKIFNARGQMIRKISIPKKGQGWQETTWDGRDQSSKPCPAGSYLILLQNGKQHQTQRINIFH
ncbi:MAG: FlgD immunoglobulin-like domain containing protein, partial [Candidatus Cloacimonadaceae bacterium]|nr:FlgD immunoglobulin-like domain containing protein [Candidatus Cloacimonadaceae bacterium]